MATVIKIKSRFEARGGAAAGRAAAAAAAAATRQAERIGERQQDGGIVGRPGIFTRQPGVYRERVSGRVVAKKNRLALDLWTRFGSGSECHAALKTLARPCPTFKKRRSDPSSFPSSHHSVSPLGWTGFDSVLPSWTGCFNGFSWISPSSTGLYRAPLHRTGFYVALLAFTGFYWVLLGSTGLYRVLLGFTRFYRVLLGFIRFHRVLLGFTGFYRV